MTKVKNAKPKDKSVAMRTLYFYWRELAQHKVMLVCLLVLTPAAMIANGYIWPLFISEIINRLTTDPNVGFAQLWPLAVGAISFNAMANLILWRVVLIVHWKLDVKGWQSLNEKIFTTLAAQSMHFHNNRFSGSIVSQTNKFVGSFERLIDTWTWNLYPMIIAIVTVGVILTAIGLPLLALVLVVISVLYIAYALISFRAVRHLNEAEAEAENKLSGQLADSITNISAVKSYGKESQETARFMERNDTVIHLSTKVLWASVRRDICFAAFMTLMVGAAFLMLAGGREWLGVQIGTLVVAVTYTVNLMNSVWNFNNIIRQVNRSLGDAFEMTKILDEPVLVSDSHNAKDLEVPHGEIEFAKVDFTHSEGDEVFRDFSLKIPAGQKIGLVGHSGSGKTTLTKLLLRFADVQNGEIVIDGQNIAAITQNSLRKNIAYVPQEPLLFHRSIAENIAYGRPDATPAEIEQAAKLANADEFIAHLADGYETLVGERGVKLSGGQRQRIVIARAILKDAPILVLDEATSALDTESEKLIQDALKNLMKNRTSIVIAHRLSTVAELDRIIVLDDGKIIEDGTHAELLAHGGKYSKLWNRQTGLANEL